MPVELLERDLVVATVMPGHGDPNGPGLLPDEDPGEQDEDEEESEGDPS
jgi:hypothetical protein